MKITIGRQAALPVTPDYDMLKTALLAAQAATPTARASALRVRRDDPHAALQGLFAAAEPGLPGGTADGAAHVLEHRFHPARSNEDGI